MSEVDAPTAAGSAASALAAFSEPTRRWFTEAFDAPTPAQAGAWPHAAAGRSVLVSAPTGSGKTLAAFLVAIDRLLTRPSSGDAAATLAPATRVVYVSPLKALAYDVDRNLRAPLVGIRRTAARLGLEVPDIDVAIRSGDTPPTERARMARHPPEVLITTPESLYLLLTSRARQTLTGVETVIVDEVHAVAGTKRGAHLALSLERLEALAGADQADASVDGAAPPAAPAAGLQRIGLSATVRPLADVARFLGGGVVVDGGWQPRPVEVVHADPDRVVDVDVVVPVPDMSRLGERIEEPPSGPTASGVEARRSIWPSVHPRILAVVRANRATIVFANSRRLAERLCARLNELAAGEVDDDGAGGLDGPPPAPVAHDAAGAPDTPAAPPVVARAHHGSVARDERVAIEEALKAGQLPCVVATSSLELGIDMGAVDEVVQVASPGSVAAGLQRIGRAGHHVGEVSRGTIFPTFRGDLLECAVVAERMRAGAIEATRLPQRPLDVLAQHVVAMTAMDAWPVDALLACVRGAASFADLSRGQLDGVLDLLAGRYPSDEFAELRPRLTWDRVADVVRGRRGAQRVAVTSGGTIPDRGLYRVELAEGEEGAGGRGRPPKRVGELDEEMVYECRPGETIVLGASTWRITDIERDRVLVVPAPGEPGKLPFWHGDAPGRPVELGRAVGALVRELDALPADAAAARLRDAHELDDWAADNLVAYLAEQREATGVLPSDRQIVVERFRDEIGDWRLVVHSPFGGAVHAPWALAIAARARERLGLEVQTMHADDGIVVRLPEADAAPPAETALIDPDDVEDLVVDELGGSALFAARFRECAARALLLPRRRPGGRTPLWQQRQRAADLLAVASRYGSFPLLLETYREVLSDVFDVPALVALLRDVAARRVRVHQVETDQASPFASSLLFDYLAGSIYDGDAPLAERRASALALDRERLAELVGSEELRDLIDADALDALEAELQWLADDRRARDADEVHDLLRVVGDLRADEVRARVADDARAHVDDWLADLAAERRAVRVRVAGEERWAAAEDAARYRDALGVPPPTGLPASFLEPVDRPTVDLVARYARTHGPFTVAEAAARLGLPRDAVELAGKELHAEGRLQAGEFRPRPAHPAQREWIDADVLRRLRRRSLAVLRREVEPAAPAALGRFLPGWQGVGVAVPGVDRVLEVIEQLQGAAVPASVLERDVLGVRVADYRPGWLDELAAAGEVVWVGQGSLGSADGRVALYLRDQVELLAPSPSVGDEPAAADWWSEAHEAMWQRLGDRGASFWPELYATVGGGDEAEAVEVLWDLVWAGLVSGDALAPLRARVGLGGRGSGRREGGSGRREGLAGGRRRRRSPRALARSGPPQVSGRWARVSDLSVGNAAATDRAAALAAQLLDRHGVLTRDAVVGEEVPGGFAGLYPVLQRMEESGRARRGYFVEGLGGAQFALPGAVDRLRAVREPGMDRDADALVLAATDPANPYGVTLSWPATGAGDTAGHRPQRRAGAWVVLADGEPVVYVERGGRSLLTFTDDPDRTALAAQALGVLVDRGRADQLAVARADGADVGEHPVAAHLRGAGFADHPKGLVRRPSR